MTELLPATFPTEDRAWSWSRFVSRHTVVGVEPARDRAGRWQVRIRRGKRTDEGEAL